MNWKPLIEELMPFYSQREIAEQVGVAESAVTRMRQGKQDSVMYDAGCKLMELIVKTRRRKARTK